MDINSPDPLILPRLASDPASPVNGSKWYNTTLNKYRVMENGVIKDEDTGGAGGTVNQGQLWAIQNKFNL